MAAEVSRVSSGTNINPKPLIPLVDVVPQLIEQEMARWRTVSANPSIASNSRISVDSTSSTDTISELFLIK